MSLTKKYLKSKSVCKVTFSIPKAALSGGNEVRLVGDFNDWKWENGYKMKAQKENFTTAIELPTGCNYQFRYLIDNLHWANDWEAEAYWPTPYGVDNSVVFVEETLDVPTKTATKAKAKKTTKAIAKKRTKKTATKDNLKKIEGIGPKIEKLLNEAGIVTFEDLAKAKLTLLKDVLTTAGSRYKMHDPTTWAEQAKLAVARNWDKLETLQKKLKGGKRK